MGGDGVAQVVRVCWVSSYYQNQDKTQIQTVEVTMFIVATGAGKNRSRKAGVDNPESGGKVTGRQAGRLRVRVGRGR
jgi:hypothetical protein